MPPTSESEADPSGDGEVTRLIQACANGDQDALDRLMPLVYDNLRAIAHGRLRLERPDHTLNTTALVHEAYLKLVEQRTASWRDRAHFFAVSARIIRNLLVDHARQRTSVKRGGGAIQLPLDEEIAGQAPRMIELLALDRALSALGELDERLEQVVECRFFAGMSMGETAEVLGTSLTTTERDWRRARAYLYNALS
jgi:RNA polymerase sigma factor (TIGR02999 family)